MQKLANTIVGEFGGVTTAEQTESEWKSLERAHKDVKQKKTKTSQVHFEYGEYLCL